MPPRTPDTNGRRLVIVESPTKANTIKRFLSDAYVVKASMGHVRDLPQSASAIPDKYRKQPWSRLGINVDENYEPLYVITKPDVVRELKSELADVDELLIATDEDREGEAIGWHLLEVLKPKVPVKRMVFHEITENAIQQALEDTRDIHTDLVEAQETRRILDRLVGYTISPLLWKKIAPRLSAGRVQSVAVRILVNREKERLAFNPASYWDVDATLSKAGDAATFEATATHVDGIRLASGKDFDPDTGRLKDGTEAGKDVLLLTEAEATALATAARDVPFHVRDVNEREEARNPSPPFTTSTLQQESSRKLKLSARDTMRIAQGLYERGLITYMRTDSTNLSSEAIQASRQRIETLYGKDYLFERVRQYASKAKGAQEAHEAIRPAGDAMKTAEEHGLRGNDKALYELIWQRTIATQMAEARLKFVTVALEAGVQDRTLTLRASGRQVLFPGFFRAYVEGSDDPDGALDDQNQPLPALQGGDAVQAHRVDASGHETKPPARITEASLVKILEQEGIGRPSTYASIIETIQNRGYVRKNGQQLVPTFIAFATNNLLEHQFARLVDTEFTAGMESDLDAIASGTLDAGPYLRHFYRGEEGIESLVETGLGSIDAREISTMRSPKWDPFVVRVGRYGPYVTATENGEEITTSIPEDWAPADVTREMLAERIEREKMGDQPVGTSEDGTTILLKNGPYGPYLQLGEVDEAQGATKKPKRVSLPPNVDMRDVDEPLARALMDLPRALGEHPKDGKKVEAGIGRYGPYVKHGSIYASLKEGDDVLDVQMDRAVELLTEKAARRGQREPLRVLGEHPETGAPLEIHDGRFGPYVKHGKVNASLRKEHSIETLTIDEALELLAAREARMAEKKGGRAKASSKTPAKKTKKRSSKAKAKNPSGPKATREDLEKHLAELEEDVRSVVVRSQGMEGRDAQPLGDVAQELGIEEAEAQRREKSGLFKLRMAFGRARKEAEAQGA